MKNYYPTLRIFLLMLVFGLASVSFFNSVYEKWTEVSVDLPKVESDSPIYIFPLSPTESLSKEFSQQQTNLIQNRDLSIYDIGNTFSNCSVNTSEFKNCEQQRIEARKFILNHWKNKERAYIIYTWQGCDNGGSYHIFIEPDRHGKWHFISRTYSNNRFEIKLVETKGYLIKYKIATNDDYPYKYGTKFLSIIDKNGGEVKRF